MNYSEIKKLDEDTLAKLKEGTGPSDQCLCSLLSPPEDEPKGLRASIKKVFGNLGPKKKRSVTGQKTVDIPLNFTPGGGVYATKEAVKRSTPCGKCGCDKENIYLKHSYANIRITTPDISSICPCPEDCLPDKEKLNNNIQVTIERLAVDDMDTISSCSELSIEEADIIPLVPEPIMERRSPSELVRQIWTEENEA